MKKPLIREEFILGHHDMQIAISDYLQRYKGFDCCAPSIEAFIDDRGTPIRRHGRCVPLPEVLVKCESNAKWEKPVIREERGRGTWGIWFGPGPPLHSLPTQQAAVDWLKSRGAGSEPTAPCADNPSPGDPSRSDQC